MARGNPQASGAAGQSNAVVVRTNTKGMSIVDRIMFYVFMIPESNCWYWGGALNNSGYGTVSGGRSTLAHRTSYEVFVGKIPDGMELDHICRERSCVNPRHLEPVTGLVNQRRSHMTKAGIYGARTECPLGHPLVAVKKGRICVTCRAQYLQKYSQIYRQDPVNRSNINAYRRQWEKRRADGKR